MTLLLLLLPGVGPVLQQYFRSISIVSLGMPPSSAIFADK